MLERYCALVILIVSQFFGTQATAELRELHAEADRIYHEQIAKLIGVSPAVLTSMIFREPTRTESEFFQRGSELGRQFVEAYKDWSEYCRNLDQPDSNCRFLQNAARNILAQTYASSVKYESLRSGARHKRAYSIAAFGGLAAYLIFTGLMQYEKIPSPIGSLGILISVGVPVFYIYNSVSKEKKDPFVISNPVTRNFLAVIQVAEIEFSNRNPLNSLCEALLTIG